MGRARGSGQPSTSAGRRRVLVADAYAGFASVFGDRRGGGRRAEPEVELAPDYPEDGPILRALTTAGVFTTAEGDSPC